MKRCCRKLNVSVQPAGSRPSIAYAGPVDVYGKRQGVLAVIVEYTRFAQFLSNLSVGQSGATFILGRDGSVVAAPDPDADEVQQLKSAAMPLLFQLREDQKREVRTLARLIGLEKVASQI